MGPAPEPAPEPVEPVPAPKTENPSAVPTSAAPVADPTAVPIMEPSSTPTPKPSSHADCNPEAPPCLHDFLGVCYSYVDCGAVGNHDSYPYTTIVHEFFHTHSPTLEPTPAIPCDPENPPCTEWYLGFCMKLTKCSEANHTETDNEPVEHVETDDEEHDEDIMNVTSWGEDTDKPTGNATATDSIQGFFGMGGDDKAVKKASLRTKSKRQ